jgi:hypothetical protein
VPCRVCSIEGRRARFARLAAVCLFLSSQALAPRVCPTQASRLNARKMPNPVGAGPVHSLLHALPLPSLPHNIERWIPGSTPISTTKDVALAVSVYLAIIFGGQDFMANRPAYRECANSPNIVLSPFFSKAELDASTRWGACSAPLRRDSGALCKQNGMAGVHDGIGRPCTAVRASHAAVESKQPRLEETCALGDSPPSASRICPKPPYTPLSKLTIPESCPIVTGFKPLFMLHNFLLSAGSGLLLALMLEEVRTPRCLKCKGAAVLTTLCVRALFADRPHHLEARSLLRHLRRRRVDPAHGDLLHLQLLREHIVLLRPLSGVERLS